MKDHEVAGARGDAGPDRRALPHVARLQNEREVQLLVEPRQLLTRPIRRPIVHDDELRAQRHGDHAVDDLVDRVRFVVDRHHDGQQRIREHSPQA